MINRGPLIVLLNFRFNAFYQAQPTRRTDSNGLATENYRLPWRPSLTSVCAHVCVCVFYVCVRAHLELLWLVLRSLSTVDKVQFFLMCFYLWQMRKKSMDCQGTWVLQNELVGGSWELFTGHWSGRGCHRPRIVRSGNCAATNDTHTQITRGAR